jgi:hypothetical protein
MKAASASLRELLRKSVFLFARLALAAAFLSAVADRFGLWCAPGATHVAWGDFSHFVAYTAKLTWYLPGTISLALAWAATAAEILLGIWLVTGIRLKIAATLSAVLLLLFACSMALAGGIKPPLDASVFSAAAAALLLAVE